MRTIEAQAHVALSLLLLLASGCGGVVGEVPEDAGGFDAGASVLDAGPADSGEADAGTTPGDGGGDPDAGLGGADAGGDAGAPDGSVSDAGGDAGAPDGSVSDAGALDAGGAADAGLPDAGSPTDGGSVLLPDGGCNAAAFLRLGWPFPGTNGLHWVVNNYVDLDSSSGLRDFMGATGAAAKTYDGHRGVDIDVPSFRQMDADFPVIAAAPGIVIGVVDGNFDRNTSCTGSANLVRIRQDDCSVALYAHFKQGSIVVATGQRVVTGQQLAVVGSSGCSSTAHVHFELTSASGALEEPFSTGRWLAPPPYSTTASVMDLNFKAGAYTDINELKDPPPDPLTLPAGSAIGVASNSANGEVGDVLSMRLLRPDGGVGSTGSVSFSQEYRHSWWWWNRTLGNDRGQWTLELRVNGGAPTTRHFTVP